MSQTRTYNVDAFGPSGNFPTDNLFVNDQDRTVWKSVSVLNASSLSVALFLSRLAQPGAAATPDVPIGPNSYLSLPSDSFKSLGVQFSGSYRATPGKPQIVTVTTMEDALAASSGSVSPQQGALPPGQLVVLFGAASTTAANQQLFNNPQLDLSTAQQIDIYFSASASDASSTGTLVLQQIVAAGNFSGGFLLKSDAVAPAGGVNPSIHESFGIGQVNGGTPTNLEAIFTQTSAAPHNWTNVICFAWVR